MLFVRWPAPGFASDYATTNVMEDKAELFDVLVGEPEIFCAQAAIDPILVAKARLLRDRIANGLSPDVSQLLPACLQR